MIVCMSRSEKSLGQSMREELLGCHQYNRKNVQMQYPNTIVLACVLPMLLLVPPYGGITKAGDSTEAHGQLTAASTESVSQEQTSMEKDNLALARLFGKAGRIDDALKAYNKALESQDPKIRAAALADIEKLLSRPNPFVSWLIDQMKVLGKVLLPVLLAVILVVLMWIFTQIVRLIARRVTSRRGASAIEVRPFSFSPSSTSTYDHFREILIVLSERLLYQSSLRQRANMLQAATVLPTIRSSAFVAQLESPMSAVAPKTWAVLSWFFRSLNPPRFTVEGSVSVDDKVYNVVIKLLQDSRLKKALERNIQKSELAEGLKDMAYEVLVSISMGSNRQ